MGMEAEVVPILLMVPDWWQGCDLVFALSVSDFFALLVLAIEWTKQGGAVSHPRQLSAASQPRPVVFIRGDWRWSAPYHQHHVSSLLVGPWWYRTGSWWWDHCWKSRSRASAPGSYRWSGQVRRSTGKFWPWSWSQPFDALQGTDAWALLSALKRNLGSAATAKSCGSSTSRTILHRWTSMADLMLLKMPPSTCMSLPQDLPLFGQLRRLVGCLYPS